MNEFGAFDAKNKLSALLDRVENGEEIVITRHGRPVARLIPDSVGIDRSQAKAAAQRIHARASRAKFGHFQWEEFKADRDAGRR